MSRIDARASGMNAESVKKILNGSGLYSYKHPLYRGNEDNASIRNLERYSEVRIWTDPLPIRGELSKLIAEKVAENFGAKLTLQYFDLQEDTEKQAYAFSKICSDEDELLEGVETLKRAETELNTKISDMKNGFLDQLLNNNHNI